MTFIALDLDKRWSEVEERIEINVLDQTWLEEVATSTSATSIPSQFDFFFSDFIFLNLNVFILIRG